MGISLRSIGRKLSDIFDANSEEDQRKRIAAGQPRYYADQQAARRPAPRQMSFESSNAPVRGGFGQSFNMDEVVGTRENKAIPSIRPIFSQGAPGAKPVTLSTVADYTVRPITRGAFRVGGELGTRLSGNRPGDYVYAPSNRFDKTILGQQPIESFSKLGRDTGVRGAGGMALGLGLTALDVTPLGGGKGKAGQKVVKELVKKGSKNTAKVVDEAAEIAQDVARTVPGQPKPKVTLKQETSSLPPQKVLSAVQTPAQTAATVLSPPTSGKPKISSRAASKVNTEHYSVSDEVRQKLQGTLDELQPDVQAKVGKKLTLKETQEYADVTNRVLNTSKTRNQTIAANAAMLKARERQAALETKIVNNEALSPAEQAELVRISTAVATTKADLGRSLGALRANAGPKEKTMVGLIMEKLAKEVDDAKAVAEAAKKYDFNDPKQLADFYRKFVRATPEDWLDKYRYTNMLSSPLTQIRNVSSNIMGGSTIAPVQKLYEGAVDALSPGPRTRYAGEAGEYLKGFWSNLDEAKKAFGDVMSNRVGIQNPDLNSLHMMPLATSGVKGKLDTVLSTATKLMEAFDQAGQALVKSGETRALNYRAGKGVNVGNIAQKAQDKATYTLFRNQLGGKEQGHVLQAVDAIPQAVAKWRNSSNPVIRNVSKFTFPFIKTPVNISKQMLEYSPLGLSTTFGAADKKAQIAKALMGTTAVGTAAGIFAANDAITFSEPDGTKEKNDFKASGKQPYSVKIGDKWISYKYLHPGISFNLAAVASVKKALDEKKIDDRTADTLLEGFAGSSRFFVDQSYFKNAQDFMTNISGESLRRPASTFANQAANTVSQLVPFRAMQTWINNMIDQTQRKTDYTADVGTQFLQNIARQLPGLSQAVPARLDSQGKPIAKPHPMINAISPASVTTDKTGGPAYGPEARKISTGRTSKEGYSLIQRDDGKYEVKIGDKTITKDDLGEARDEIAKDSLKKSNNNISVVGEKVYRKSKDGSVTPMRKLDYDYSVGQNKLQSAKKKGDFNGWLQQADVQLQNLETQLQDPTLDELDKSNILEKIDNLMAEGEKYLSYGGFKKGKTGRGSGGGRGRGGRGGRVSGTGGHPGSIYKYAVSRNVGGQLSRPTVSIKASPKAPGRRSVRRAAPKVSLKRSRV